MRLVNNAFALLADRARGDASAKVQLRRELEPELVRIVRRVVQHGTGYSPLDRRILAEADRFGLDSVTAASDQEDFLVRQVARAICAQVVSGSRPAPRKSVVSEDTVLA